MGAIHAAELLSAAILYLPVACTILVGLLTTAIGVFLLIPGPEPERTLEKIKDFLEKYSRKP